MRAEATDVHERAIGQQVVHKEILERANGDGALTAALLLCEAEQRIERLHQCI